MALTLLSTSSSSSSRRTTGRGPSTKGSFAITRERGERGEVLARGDLGAPFGRPFLYLRPYTRPLIVKIFSLCYGIIDALIEAMSGHAYYNEIDPFAAQWLRSLIANHLIADGDVDERSIRDVSPEDIDDYTQCHFFAGIGVWSYALRCAGWPDDRKVWTGSCPCQPFSTAGKRGGFEDERHLWPEWFRLIRESKPDVIFGEQVASKDGLSWFDLVSTDLEGEGYAVGACDMCAAGFGAPHIRQRLYFVAHDSRSRRRKECSEFGRLASGDRTERITAAFESSGGVGELAHSRSQSARRRLQQSSESSEEIGFGTSDQSERSGGVGLVADFDGWNSRTEGIQRSGEHGQQSEDSGVSGSLDNAS